MSNTKLNCCKCGKEFELTERIYTSGDLWQCEDCAIKQMQENDDKDKTIADLEAKLAEKDKAIENWQTMYESVVQTCHNDKEEIKRLREINLEVSIKQLQFQHEQDKISFAVEQLLDIKEEVFGTREMGIIFDIPPVQDAFDVIENKIKQLKEGK